MIRRSGAVPRLVKRPGFAQFFVLLSSVTHPVFFSSAFNFSLRPMLRRTFLKNTAAAATATVFAGPTLLAAAAKPAPKLAVGLDNYALRALGWKAPELIDYAASLKCDTLFISDLDALESLDDPALRLVRARRSRRPHALRRELEHLSDIKDV